MKVLAVCLTAAALVGMVASTSLEKVEGETNLNNILRVGHSLMIQKEKVSNKPILKYMALKHSTDSNVKEFVCFSFIAGASTPLEKGEGETNLDNRDWKFSYEKEGQGK